MEDSVGYCSTSKRDLEFYCLLFCLIHYKSGRCFCLFHIADADADAT